MAERPILFSSSERRWKYATSRVGVPVDVFVEALNGGRKICGGCARSLLRTPEYFGSEAKAFDGLKSTCRDCVAAAKKKHYAATRPAQRARQLRYQRENRERLYAYNNQWQRKRNAALRAEMLAAYGGACACCGEAEPIFLDLDHIHNDGAQHRHDLGNGTQVLLFLRASGWPKDRFQLLCCNCNQGKARNGGVCPHVMGRGG